MCQCIEKPRYRYHLCRCYSNSVRKDCSFPKLQEANISYSIKPGVNIQSWEKVLQPLSGIQHILIIMVDLQYIIDLAQQLYPESIFRNL